MPRPRRPITQNKSLPKFLQAGEEKFEHWGRKFDDVFHDELTSPSPIHLAVESSSHPEVESFQFIEYRPCTDDTSRDCPNELPPSEPYTNDSQSGSSSSFYHQRSKRIAQNTSTSRGTTNDPAFRPPRRSLRQRESRQPRHRTRASVDGLEASELSLHNHSSSSNTLFPNSLQRGPMIELTDVDRWASAASVQESADYFPSDPRTINGQMPASSSRSPQRTVFSEPPPISPSAGANGSQNIIPIQRMASNLGTQAGSLLHEMDPFSSGDAAPANPAVPHPSVSIFEPPISIPLNDASTLVYSTCHPFTWEDAHVSSSSLGPMAQHGYYNFGSLDKAIMNDSACDETILSSYYPVSDNCLPPSQPTCSVNPRVYSGMPVNNPVGGHSAFSASNRSLSHVRSTGLQATSSSSQVAQTTQDYVPTFGDNADVQDTFFLPEMNHRNLPRSYDFQGEPRGLSQGEVYRKSQRSRHASSGLSPTYASTGHNHFPNAIATSSISRLEPRHPFL